MTFEVHVANARALCEGLSDGMYDLINDAYDSYDVFPCLIFPGQIKNLTFA